VCQTGFTGVRKVELFRNALWFSGDVKKFEKTEPRASLDRAVSMMSHALHLKHVTDLSAVSLAYATKYNETYVYKL